MPTATKDKSITKNRVRVAGKPNRPTTGMAWAKQFGLPIYDADEPLEVTLLKRDIRSGILGDQEQCAIAKCMQRTYDSPAWIGLGFAFVVWDGWIERFRVPDGTARQEVVFDHGGEMADATMILAPVPPSNRMGAHTTRTDTGNGKKRKSKHVVAKVQGDKTRRG